MESNPLRVISNSCAEMRQLSQALQAARGNSATDVSDVFDIASSILTTILKESSNGLDPYEYILENMKKINQMLASKEQIFKTNMNNLLSETSQKVTQISECLKNSNLNVNYVLENVKKIKDDFIQKQDQENQKIIKEFQIKLKEEEEDKKKEEKAAYEYFESYLSQVISEITVTYNQRLKQADDINNNLEKKLQTVVHDKHQHKANRHSIFEEEEKRVLAIREKLTKEFNEFKDEIDKKILQLKQSIEKLKGEINQNKNSNNLTLQQKENELLSEQKEMINNINNEIKKLNDQLKSLSYQKSRIEIDIMKTQNDSKEQINNVIHEYKEKFKQIRKETIQMKEQASNEIEQKYKPKIDDLLSEIKENEDIKSAQEDQFKEKQNEEFKETDKDVQELNEQNNKKASVIKTKLSEKKKELRAIQNKRNKDLEKVKNEKVKVLAAATQNDEEKVKKRASIINEFMKKFDEAQQRLFEKNFITLEEMNRRRDALIRKLEQAELEGIDKIKDDESFNDKEYEIEIKLLKEEFHDHKEKVSSIQNRIEQTKSRIDILNDKIRNVERSTIRAIEQYIGINDDKLEDDIKKVSFDGEKVTNLTDRVKNASFLIEQRTKLLQNEAEELKNSINSAHDSFEKRFDEIELHIKSTKNRLKMKESEIEEKKEKIVKKIENQHKTIIELEKAMSRKGDEAGKFEKTINDKKMQFAKETKEKYESDLNEVSQKPIELQNEIERIRSEFSVEIDKLKLSVDEAKKRTSEISQFQLKERERRTKEETEKLLNLHKEKMKKLENEHKHRMNELSEKLASARNKHQNEMNQVESNFKISCDSISSEFNSKMVDLDQEKRNLLLENQNLCLRYEEYKTGPCQECEKKKELIRKLLQTKKSMEKQMEQHQEILQKNDQNMNAIFGVKKKQVATPLLDMPKNQQHAPVIAKPGSGAGLRAKSQLNQKQQPANARLHQGVASALAPTKNAPA